VKKRYQLGNILLFMLAAALLMIPASCMGYANLGAQTSDGDMYGSLEQQGEYGTDERSTDELLDEGYERAVFAAGCFWGVEYQFKQKEGVIKTTVGYTGGRTENPTYRDVCTHTTGHAEAVEVVFDPDLVAFEDLAKLFFESHDFTQVDRQGPDIGDQYRSEIFYTSDEQKETAESLIAELTDMGYDVATRVTKASEFYPAEEYHQDYYSKTGGTPYCHTHRQIFDE
jgi:peptide methionine sulfoxide reductase msrA/msrB